MFLLGGLWLNASLNYFSFEFKTSLIILSTLEGPV